MWALALLLGVILYGVRPVSRWKLRHIPGPWGWWLLGSIPAVLREGIAQLNLSLAVQYGPVFKISYAKYAVVAVADPELARPLSKDCVMSPGRSNR